MSHETLSRRAILAGAASVPALALPAAIATAAPAVATVATATLPDPIFAAIAEHRRLFKEASNVSTMLDEAEHEKGRPPSTLIAWRTYSAIGGGEIERARDRFLATRADPKKIEREYCDAKIRERVANRNRRKWYKQNGLAYLKAKSDRADKAEQKALWALTKIRPTTAAGAGALVAYVRVDLQTGSFSWQVPALANAAKALRGMDDKAVQS